MPRTIRFPRPLAAALLAALALAAASLAPGAASAGPPPYKHFFNITKELAGPTSEMPGQQEYTFALAKKSLNGSTDPADLARMPDLDDPTLYLILKEKSGGRREPFDGALEIGAEQGFHDSMDVDGPTTTLRRAYGLKINIRAFKQDFNGPGVYRYTLTETGAVPGPQGPVPGLRMSRASYTVTLYIPESGFNSHDLTVEQDTDDDGGPGAGKVDPVSGVVFVNKIAPRPASFKLRKTVAGDYGDRGRDFDLSLTLAVPSTAAPVPSYTGTIDGREYRFAPGATTPFKLRHGQELVFADLPAGTELTYTEAGAEGYTPSASTTLGAGGAPAVQAGSEGADFTLGKVALAGGPNSSELTNTYRAATPTGIAVGILPHVVMVAVPALAAAAHLVHRRRMARRS